MGAPHWDIGSVENSFELSIGWNLFYNKPYKIYLDEDL